jgi:hypothetical protein
MSTYKVFIQNNYLIIQCDDPVYSRQGLAKNIFIRPVDPTDPVSFEIWNMDNSPTKWATLKLSELVDEGDTPYDYSTWTAFYTANTGQFGGSGGASGGATEATLSALNNKVPTQGQKTMDESVPVAIASDQSPVPVSASSLPLPTGASTSAKQDTQIGQLVDLGDAVADILATQSTSVNQSAQTTLLQNISDSTKLEDSPSASGDRLMSVGGVRLDADTSPVSADGDYHSLVFNSTGRVKVSAKPAATSATTGTITTSTSVVPMECARETGATLTLTGTFTGVNITFEFSLDSTNGTDGSWFGLLGTRTNAETIELVSGVVATGLVYGWQFGLPAGTTYIRARATAFTSGTANVTWKPGAFAYDPVARVSTLGTGTATVGSIASIGTSVTPGTAAANLGKAEDAVATSGDTGVFALAVRRDTLTTGSSATGDYNEFAVDQYGAQLVRSFEKHAKTYSASAKTSLAVSARDVMMIPGNAVTVVYVTKLIISGTATVARLQDLQVVRRSTANTGGTSSSMSVAQHDSTDAAPSSTPITYTANPSALGTLAGTIRQSFLALGTPASSDDNIIVFDFGDKGRPVVLRGTTQSLCIDMSATSLSGDVLSVSVEWYEI